MSYIQMCAALSAFRAGRIALNLASGIPAQGYGTCVQIQPKAKYRRGATHKNTRTA